MYKRKLFANLEAHLAEKRVTVLTGMRRVGKTTTLNYLLDQVEHSNKLYLDLERMEDRYIFTRDSFTEMQIDLEIRGIDFTVPSVIAIDEVQLMPDIVSFVKYYHDHFPVKFILTGSSSYYLRNRITESLSGRKLIFELFPLDFHEFLVFKEVDTTNLERFRWQSFQPAIYLQYKAYYEEYIQFGGFPEIVLTEDRERKVKFIKEIIDSYVELDVKLLSDYSAIDELYQLILLLSARVGSKLDYSKIGSVLGINRHKVKDYIHLLERTYFIHLIEPFTANIDRAVSLQRKVYLADSGILNHLAQISTGALFENTIATQLRKLGTLNFFQKRGGQEIDFILDQRKAIEVKETPTTQHLSTLQQRAIPLQLPETVLIGRYPPGSSFRDFIWGGVVF